MMFFLFGLLQLSHCFIHVSSLQWERERESELECTCWYRDEHSAAREDKREELGGAVEEERVEVPWEVAGDKELVAKQAH